MAKKPVTRRKPVAPDSTVMDRRVMTRFPPSEMAELTEDLARINELTAPAKPMTISDYIRLCRRIAHGRHLAGGAR